jgi:hypothetical protein
VIVVVDIETCVVVGGEFRTEVVAGSESFKLLWLLAV